MKDVGQRTAEAAALKHAVPYIRIFKGKNAFEVVDERPDDGH